MSLEDDMKGTPIEEFGLLRNRLAQFKTTVGYSDLVKLLREQQGQLLKMFMSDKGVDLIQLRADFRAWQKVISVIDEPIEQYDIWLAQTLEQENLKQQQMMQQQQGRNYVG
jgi:hypothetical protein